VPRDSRELAESAAARERLYRRPKRLGRGARTGLGIPAERVELISRARTWQQTAT
jgi:hypothetical protein